MLVLRWTMKTKRGKWRKVAEILERARAESESLRRARICTSFFGTMDQVSLEWEIEKFADFDISSKKPYSDAVEAELHQLLESGDSIEIWTLVE